MKWACWARLALALRDNDTVAELRGKKGALLKSAGFYSFFFLPAPVIELY